MPIIDRYSNPGDLPSLIPVFPLQGCILLPRTSLPLNIYEPRYLQMVNDALGKDRVIGIVQPASQVDDGESPKGKGYPLRLTGSAGRITSFTETDDGRVLITLTGIARFSIEREESSPLPYRMCHVSYEPYRRDFTPGHGQEAVDVPRLLGLLRAYLDACKLSTDWTSIERSPTELLVNTLAMISPYGVEEKQALLEAPDLKQRSEVLMTLAQMDLARPDDGSGTSLQ